MSTETIVTPKGFLAAGLHCGIKRSGKPDVGLLVCPEGATAAAVFTTNQVVSAAVEVCREHVRAGRVYAVVVNSGNANACTGKLGLKNARTMCAQTANSLGERIGKRVAAGDVLIASTGIIGEQLPMVKVKAGITQASEDLSTSASAGRAFVRAIMTTDTKPKQTVRRLTISSVEATLAGAVKGAGMIAPNMATTLLFLTTDVAISKTLLAKALRHAVGESLNKLTVDGHQSTNDTAIILASGQARNRPITNQCPRFRKFVRSLTDLCDDLARRMAHDAEGATRIFKVVVTGAATRDQAARACRAVADYPLVKCAVHGGDPNWGRIVCAVGSCGVKLDPAKLSCKLDDLVVFRRGAPTGFDRHRAAAIVSQTEHTITVDLGIGRAHDFCYGCDLSRGYVKINADYHT